MKDLNAVLPASGKNSDDTGWVRFKLPIASDPGQIQGAVDTFAWLNNPTRKCAGRWINWVSSLQGSTAGTIDCRPADQKRWKRADLNRRPPDYDSVGLKN